jgi:hypothetical protein
VIALFLNHFFNPLADLKELFDKNNIYAIRIDLQNIYNQGVTVSLQTRIGIFKQTIKHYNETNLNEGYFLEANSKYIEHTNSFHIVVKTEHNKTFLEYMCVLSANEFDANIDLFLKCRNVQEHIKDRAKSVISQFKQDRFHTHYTQLEKDGVVRFRYDWLFKELGFSSSQSAMFLDYFNEQLLIHKDGDTIQFSNITVEGECSFVDVRYTTYA